MPNNVQRETLKTIILIIIAAIAFLLFIIISSLMNIADLNSDEEVNVVATANSEDNYTKIDVEKQKELLIESLEDSQWLKNNVTMLYDSNGDRIKTGASFRYSFTYMTSEEDEPAILVKTDYATSTDFETYEYMFYLLTARQGTVKVVSLLEMQSVEKTNSSVTSEYIVKVSDSRIMFYTIQLGTYMYQMYDISKGNFVEVATESGGSSSTTDNIIKNLIERNGLDNEFYLISSDNLEKYVK